MQSKKEAVVIRRESFWLLPSLMVKIFQHLNEYIIGIVWIISLMDTLIE